MMAKIHSIGEPETESEALAIKFLANSLPPSKTHIIHNFELCSGGNNQGGSNHQMPYEYDIVILGEYAIYHVEVKHFTGIIKGDKHRWKFESGNTFPSPIPLANKKSKILASIIKKSAYNFNCPFVDTIILITDSKAKIRIMDEPQADRILQIDSSYAIRRLTDCDKLPHSCRNHKITSYHDKILECIIGKKPKPSNKIKEIGLYNVVEKIAQYDGSHTVFLASHKYISTRPKTILKVFTLDLYLNTKERDQKIKEIFHDQEALRLISSHPNIIRTGDFFAHGSNYFVLPHEYFEKGRTLEDILDNNLAELTWQDKRFIVESLAKGLRHCHKAGIVHRDVKPHSIVVVPQGDGDGHYSINHRKTNKYIFLDDEYYDSEEFDDDTDGNDKVLVKLVNFDLARINNAPSNAILSNLKERLDPQYTAPEVWNNPYHNTTASSDVFSLGLTFYELLTNRQHKPFVHIERDIINKNKKSIDLDIPLLIGELSVPGRRSFYGKTDNLIRTIRAMVEINPKKRLQNMDQVIDELNLIRDGDSGGLRKSELRASMIRLSKICD